MWTGDGALRARIWKMGHTMSRMQNISWYATRSVGGPAATRSASGGGSSPAMHVEADLRAVALRLEPGAEPVRESHLGFAAFCEMIYKIDILLHRSNLKNFAFFLFFFFFLLFFSFFLFLFLINNGPKHFLKNVLEFSKSSSW